MAFAVDTADLPCGCGPHCPCELGAALFASGPRVALSFHLESQLEKALGSTALDRMPTVARQLCFQIATAYGVHAAEIVGHRRQHPISFARHAWWAALKALDPIAWSYPRIGQLTGHDHTTVMAGVAKHHARNPTTLRLVEAPRLARNGGRVVKALSLRQPWLWAVLELGKTIENRRWNTHYRGPILLHAAKGCTGAECMEALLWMAQEANPDTMGVFPGLGTLARGGICGYAEIVNVVPPCDRPGLRPDIGELRWHMPEQYGFVLRNVRRVPFIPYPGSLGLFEVSSAVAEQAQEALRQ